VELQECLTAENEGPLDPELVRRIDTIV
jgi:hypothetical protein